MLRPIVKWRYYWKADTEIKEWFRNTYFVPDKTQFKCFELHHFEKKNEKKLDKDKTPLEIAR